MGVPSDPLVGAALSQGRYHVLAKLGEGGMGSVYTAHDTNLDTTVVVKMPRRAMLEDAEIASRFATEVRALVRLRHPHIVKVCEIGEYQDAPFAVMEYLSGGSLEDRYGLGGVTPPRPADPAELAGWLPTIAAALDFAHGQGYVHRDVKPPNILFDGQGNAFLGDFGVAKLIAASEGRAGKRVTGTGMVLGTPGYMAPEVILGKVPDGRADQYALGVVVYEVLSGRRPFGDEVGTAVLVRQTTSDPEPLDRVRPDLSADLSATVARAMSRDPALRYLDCATFAGEALATAASYRPAAVRAGTVAMAAPTTHRLCCPSCTKGLKIPQTAAGMAVRCPACSTKLKVMEDLTCLVPIDHPSAGGTISISALNTMPLAAQAPPPAPRTVVESAAPFAGAAGGTYALHTVPPLSAPRVTEPLGVLSTLRDPERAPVPARGTWNDPRTIAWIGGAVAAAAVICVAVLALAKRPATEPPSPAAPPVAVARVEPKREVPSAPKLETPRTAPDPAPSNPSKSDSSDDQDQGEPADPSIAPAPVASILPTTPTPHPPVQEAVSQEPVPVDILEFKAHPDQFVGRTLIPDGYLKVGTKPRPLSGHLAISIMDSEDHRVADSERGFSSDGPVFVIDRNVAKNLEQVLSKTGFRSIASARCRSILTLRVDRIRLDNRPRVVATVMAMELLPEWNKLWVAQRRFQGAFHVLRVTPDGESAEWTDGATWLPRLGTQFVEKSHKDVVDARRRLANQYNRQVTEQQLSRFMANEARQAFMQSEAQANAVRRAFGGR